MKRNKLCESCIQFRRNKRKLTNLFIKNSISLKVAFNKSPFFLILFVHECVVLKKLRSILQSWQFDCRYTFWRSREISRANMKDPVVASERGKNCLKSQRGHYQWTDKSQNIHWMTLDMALLNSKSIELTSFFLLMW